MNRSEQELATFILQDPLDDNLRIELENLLASTDPNSVQLEFLRRERAIAQALNVGKPIDDLIRDYTQFRILKSDYTWDMRGCIDHIFRPFSLWLVSCNVSRRFPLSVAIQQKFRKFLDFDVLPIEIVRGRGPDSILQLKEGILDFVCRYCGASGNEPVLADDEIEIAIFATYSCEPLTRTVG